MSNSIKRLSRVVPFVALASSGCGASPPPASAAPTSLNQPAPGPAATVSTPALLLDLPRAEDWSLVQMVVRVDLLANGETTLDGRRVQSDADLTVALHQANAVDPELRAVVRADTSVPYGRVIHALDLIKQAGIERIAFGVTPVGGGAAPKPSGPAPSGGSLPGLLGGQAWNCSFPAAADAESIDNAAVILFVAVDGMGKPRWVRILQDPGYGFAQAAAECAMAKQYAPARDESGLSVQAMTPPIRVRFVR